MWTFLGQSREFGSENSQLSFLLTSDIDFIESKSMYHGFRVEKTRFLMTNSINFKQTEIHHSKALLKLLKLHLSLVMYLCHLCQPSGSDTQVQGLKTCAIMPGSTFVFVLFTLCHFV